MLFTIESTLVAILFLVIGLILMIVSSKKTVDYSVELASILNVPPLIIGVVLISLGTDLPEIINSVLSNYFGHADISIGDSVGSILTQLTLVFGILPFFGGAIKFKRRELAVIGGCLILSLIFLFTIFEKGTFTRLNAFFLVASLGLFTMIITTSVAKSDFEKTNHLTSHKRKGILVLLVFVFLLGVGAGSVLIINSVIKLAEDIHIPEYFISFFIVGIGTSLPELFVDITAIKKKQYNIAIGDILGSCLVDATLSIGLGQLLFPQKVSTVLANQTILYTIIVAAIVILVLALRRKLDKKTGILFIILYFFSYSFLLI
ncbi:MAG: sodium:calcium antiporter [Chloroflexi bacterium]|nr:sodium:calcium antiporter [Chloroflexota bacterium]